MYVNAPRYLLRKFCTLKLLKDLPIGKTLEIGCGAGDFCHTLYQKGFNVTAIDSSKEAIALCRERFKDCPASENFHIKQDDFYQLNESFDIIFFFEVLEHLEKDQEALTKINSLLKPKGYLFLSVPAHKKWYGPYDSYTGHLRRYEKKGLIELLTKSGFSVETIWSYGVPLANLTEKLRNILYNKKKTTSMEERTLQSGVDRNIESRFRFLFNDIFLFPFYWLQMIFVSMDIGTGYLIKAKKL